MDYDLFDDGTVSIVDRIRVLMTDFAPDVGIKRPIELAVLYAYVMPHEDAGELVNAMRREAKAVGGTAYLSTFIRYVTGDKDDIILTVIRRVVTNLMSGSDAPLFDDLFSPNEAFAVSLCCAALLRVNGVGVDEATETITGRYF